MNLSKLMDLLEGCKVAGFGGNKVLIASSESEYCGIIKTVILDFARNVVIIEGQGGLEG